MAQPSSNSISQNGDTERADKIQAEIRKFGRVLSVRDLIGPENESLPNTFAHILMQAYVLGLRGRDHQYVYPSNDFGDRRMFPDESGFIANLNLAHFMGTVMGRTTPAKRDIATQYLAGILDADTVSSMLNLLWALQKRYPLIDLAHKREISRLGRVFPDGPVKIVHDTNRKPEETLALLVAYELGGYENITDLNARTRSIKIGGTTKTVQDWRRSYDPQDSQQHVMHLFGAAAAKDTTGRYMQVLFTPAHAATLAEFLRDAYQQVTDGPPPRRGHAPMQAARKKAVHVTDDVVQTFPDGEDVQPTF